MKNPLSLEWTPEKIQRFWNHQSQSSEDYYSRKASASLLRLLGHRLDKTLPVLDYGCGDGGLLERLLAQGFLVSGIEFSAMSCERIRQKLSGYPRFRGVFETKELLARERRFGTIFLIEVIEHLPNATLDNLMRDLRQLLLEGGVVVITTPNNEDLTREEVYCAGCGHTFHRWQHIRSWSRESLRAFLHSNGFTVKKLWCVNLLWTDEIKHRLKRLAGRDSQKKNLVCVAAAN